MSGAESSGSSGRCFPSDCLQCNVAKKWQSTWGYCYVLTQLRVHLSFRSLIRRKLWMVVTHRLCWGFASKQHQHSASWVHQTAIGWATSTLQPPNKNNEKIHPCDYVAAVPSAINCNNTTMIRTAASRVPQTTPDFRIRKSKLLFRGLTRRAPVPTALPSMRISLASLLEGKWEYPALGGNNTDSLSLSGQTTSSGTD